MICMKNTSLLALVGLALVGLLGCKSSESARYKPVPQPSSLTRVTKTNASTGDLLKMPTEPFILGPGDQLEIELIGMPSSRTTATVGPDGKVYFHLLPGLDVWGQTLTQAKTSLEKELAQFITDPQVAVTLRAVGSKNVWMLGRVAKPGVYQMATPMTLVEAFALAGGTARSISAVTTEDLGDLRHSFVVRQGELLPVDFAKLLREGDMTQNIYLRPDDFVFVPSSLSREIYVLGAVRMPQAIPYKDNATVVSAVASAYGTIKDAYLSQVAVVRGSMSSPEMIVVDYNAIVRGQAPDFPLEPHDIVYVPLSPYRVLTKYLDMIVNTFVTTVAANEGTLLVDPNAAVISPSVNVGQ